MEMNYEWNFKKACSCCFTEIEEAPFVSSCGYILCNSCQAKDETSCMFCNIQDCGRLLVDAEDMSVPQRIRECFSNPKEIVERLFESFQFQNFHQQRHIHFLQNQLKKKKEEKERLEQQISKQGKKRDFSFQWRPPSSSPSPTLSTSYSSRSSSNRIQTDSSSNMQAYSSSFSSRSDSSLANKLSEEKESEEILSISALHNP